MARARKEGTVRLSSKGQVVIPASIRRELGLKTGRVLRVRAQSPRQIVLSLPEEEPESLEEMLKRARAWKSKVNLVDELHSWRQRQREEEARRRERGGD